MAALQEKKLEKKRKILENAYQLFKSKNIYNTAIDDIVKASGIARGTFYLYFKDKSAVAAPMDSPCIPIRQSCPNVCFVNS